MNELVKVMIKEPGQPGFILILMYCACIAYVIQYKQRGEEMKKTRTFRLDDSTIEKLGAIKNAYDVFQNSLQHEGLNLKVFSTANVIEKLIEKEYQALIELGGIEK